MSFSLLGLGAVIVIVSCFSFGAPRIAPRLPLASVLFVGISLDLWMAAYLVEMHKPTLGPWARAIVPGASSLLIAALALWALAPHD